GTPSRRASYATLAKQALQSAGGPIFGQGSTTGAEGPGGLTFAVQMAEVEVDEETGVVRVTRLAAVHDVGRAINPLSIEGQVAGGVTQGMGFALTEWLRVQDGEVLTTNLMTYLLPTAPDVPRVEVSVLEEFPGAGPFGAKGVGEQPVIPTAAAIANALANATGVQLRDLPLTAERVLAALRGREKPAGSKATAS
ncbi:MAG: xanthine dehydrogenase family protein molybdopterin-binding subunit, partial [Deltaproteobacteria bacterium]|nr:xanthine dehydrogenase family protein molybdopterin-binding subunit [Deltaproteobacteria bacterium]